MFVLCPHCHFLVGMDPRTGGPPAACPKCGGSVVQPIAPPTPDAPALDPFVAAALPSVAPTLPAADPVVDAAPEAKPAKTSMPAGPAVPGSEATEPKEAPAIVAPASSAPATVAAKADAGTVAAPAPAVVASDALPAAADAATTRPSPDEMIAALATRPARKPRPPRTRTKKEAAPASSAADAAAGPPVAVAPASSAPAPAAAASLGARLRALFARTPRRPDAGKATSPDATSTPAPEASSEAAPATPALSIRNRGRRPGAKASAVAGPAAGPTQTVATGDPASAAVPARVAAESSSAVAATSATPSDPLQAAPAPGADADPMPRGDTTPTAGARSPGSSVPSRDEPGSDRDPTQLSASTTAPAVAPVPATRVDAPPPPLRPAPSFATTRATTGRARRDYRAITVAAALSCLLGLQLLLAQRTSLAADAGWRPAIAALCAALRCELPAWREPAAFTMLNRHVRPHPDAPGTLLIDASFRNDARWPQPWPRLELILSDVDGRTVGARTFDVRDYLGTAPAQPELAPGQSASLSLAVVEPAPDIVAFTFDFR